MKEPLKGSLVTGDTGFFTEENLQEANKRKIEVLIPDQQFRQRYPDFGDRKEHGKKDTKYTIEDFDYDKKNKRTAKNPVRTIYIANKKYKENLSEKMRRK